MIQSLALRAFFQTQRMACNQRVAQVRHQHPRFSTDDLQWFIEHCLDPLMRPLEAENPLRTFKLAEAGFGLGLELVALHWVADESRRSLLHRLWTELYPSMLETLVAAPADILAPTANLLQHLLSTPGTSPQRWLDTLARAGDCLDSPACWRRAALAGAWLAGLAHYRDSALRELAAMPAPLACRLLQVPKQRLGVALARLGASRWCALEALAGDKPDAVPVVARRVGQCSLLGGLFERPPQVRVCERHLWVQSGQSHWQLYADAFGAVLLPAAECPAGRPQRLPVAPALQALLPDIDTFSSGARLSDTLALTSPESFAVLLLACPAGEEA